MLKQIVEALRDPRHPQTRNNLVDDEGRVCAVGLIMAQVMGYRVDHGFLVDGEGGHHFFLAPLHVEDALGPDLVQKLLEWNDVEGLTFAQIAERLDA